ncbi:MAG: minor capsid protein [Ruminococcus sp.]|nr:minor capsid protein [Ruminococcus sp.]
MSWKPDEKWLKIYNESIAPKQAAKTKKAGITADISWGEFEKSIPKKFTDAQKFIDASCIKLMTPFTPMRNGILYKSATLGTKIGSGHIVYNSPYARYQYYGVVYGPNLPIFENGVLVGFFSPKKKHPTNRELQYNKTRHPKAQRLWFEVMKKKHGPAILRGAAAIMGGKAK